MTKSIYEPIPAHFNRVVVVEAAWFDEHGYLSHALPIFEGYLRKYGPSIFPMVGHYEYRPPAPDTTFSDAGPAKPSQLLTFSVERVQMLYDAPPQIAIHQQLPYSTYSDSADKAVIYHGEIYLMRGEHAHRRLGAFRDKNQNLHWVETGRNTWIDHSTIRLPPGAAPTTCFVLYNFLSRRLFNAARGSKLLRNSGANPTLHVLQQDWYEDWTENGFNYCTKHTHAVSRMRPNNEELALFERLRTDTRHLKEADIQAYLKDALALSARRLALVTDEVSA